MALHIGGKLASLLIVTAALITAFSAPRPEIVSPVPLSLEPWAAVTQAAQPQATPHPQPVGPVANPRFELRATAYNSLPNQTSGNPHVTATGSKTRFGVVAVSRDLLPETLPYGSLIRLRDLGAFHTGNGVGKFQPVLDDQQLFVVEDTMHARKRQQLDVWFEEYATAVDWGVRKVEVELVRYGRDGPELTPSELAQGAHAAFDTSPMLVASR